MSLVYQDQTRLLRKCFFDVQNEIGLGRKEEAYHRACTLWLRHNRVPFRSKLPHHLLLVGSVAHTLIPDLVIADSITIELKTVPRKLASFEYVQLFDHLKCRNDRLGLLVNLGLDRVHVKRIVYDAPKYQLTENWQHWTGMIDGRPREVGMKIRSALATVFDGHATGYGQETTNKLVRYAINQHQLACRIAPYSKAYYQQ